MDKVSVIMAVYNCVSTVGESIESILGQTYKNIEFIICDDGSSDGTYEVVKAYREAYPDKIILLKNGENRRLAFSLNRCLEYVTGKYVARMDGDDISESGRLEKQVEYLRVHPEVQLVGTAMKRFSDKGTTDIVHTVVHPDRRTLRKRLPFYHATIMTYKSVYEKLGGYTVSPKITRTEDYELWFRFYREGFAGDNIDEPLYLVREDEKAIRRRTAVLRWEGFGVTRRGFRMLGYPKIWLIRAFFVALLKCLIPFKLYVWYRARQVRKNLE